MFGLGYVKVPPTTFVMQVRNGEVKREGTGLAFFYYRPSSTVVEVPVGSTDVPFIFNEVTRDFQGVSVQGHLTYRVAEPRKLAALLDFSVVNGRYATDDPEKLPTRIAQAAQTATRAELQGRALRTALVEADLIAARVGALLRASEAMKALGVEVLGFDVLALKPAPETGRALEAEARERLLREADDAIYNRRNNAVEQERRIKENELSTEKAVAEKKQDIEQTKLDGRIALEDKRRQLVAVESENVKAMADAQSYASQKQLEPLRDLDPKSLQILAMNGSDSRHVMALAFQEIAANAARVGTLNISPDLLETLLQKRPERER